MAIDRDHRSIATLVKRLVAYQDGNTRCPTTVILRNQEAYVYDKTNKWQRIVPF